jgi:hypothetical protein
MDRDQNIRIKLKIGNIEAEIECQEDNAKMMVDTVLQSIQEKRKELASILPEPSLTKIPISRTCKGVILDLWAEGWFNTARQLSEVWEEMSRRGFHFHRTAVSHTLLELVREGHLTRMGKVRRYRYIQRNPP